MSKVIVIDAGHGGRDPGACGNGLKEKDINLSVAKKLGTNLNGIGFKVIYTRTGDTYPELIDRAKLANGNNADLFVSIHCNSFTPESNGVETLVYSNKGENNRIAKLVQDSLVSVTGFRNRGIKARPDVCVLRETKMTAILVELGFISNTAEAYFLGLDNRQSEMAASIAKSIGNYFGISKAAAATTPIIAKASASAAQAFAWAKSKNATALFMTLAATFWEVAEVRGIDPVAAYCQSAKETGYGRFGGVLDETYCNPCGMKNSEGGGDYDKNAHMRFYSWKSGIEGQADHLALYAGAQGYPKESTQDPRHFPYLLGSAKTVEELGGKWAPSRSYGEDIVKMMKELQSTKAGASPVSKNITATIEKGKVNIDGKIYEFDRILTDGSSFVKLRDFEQAGFFVSYDAEKKIPILYTTRT